MTKKGPPLILIGALSLLSSASLSQDQAHVLVTPNDIVWGPASDKVPPGARFALLAGDPSKRASLTSFAPNCRMDTAFRHIGIPGTKMSRC
jgi:hypothetical protein